MIRNPASLTTCGSDTTYCSYYSYCRPISLLHSYSGLSPNPVEALSLSQPASAWRSTPLHLYYRFPSPPCCSAGLWALLALSWLLHLLRMRTFCLLIREQDRADKSIATKTRKSDSRISNAVLMARRSSMAMTAVSSTTTSSLGLVLGTTFNTTALMNHTNNMPAAPLLHPVLPSPVTKSS